MIVIERRLAEAYARLRNPGAVGVERPPADEQAPLDLGGVGQAGYNPIELLEMDGLAGVEGPYPQLQITRSFRWQVAPRSWFTFESPNPTDAWLEIEFGNVEEQQTVRVYMGEGLVNIVRPPETGWPHLWRVALPVTVNAGLVRVGVEAERSTRIEADQRSLHIAIYKVRLRPRRPGDSSVVKAEGVRDLVGAPA